MTREEYWKVRKEVLKSVLDMAEEKYLEILNEDNYDGNKGYLLAGADIIKSIIECEYKAEPACLTRLI